MKPVQSCDNKLHDDYKECLSDKGRKSSVPFLNLVHIKPPTLTSRAGHPFMLRCAPPSKQTGYVEGCTALCSTPFQHSCVYLQRSKTDQTWVLGTGPTTPSTFMGLVLGIVGLGFRSTRRRCLTISQIATRMSPLIHDDLVGKPHKGQAFYENVNYYGNRY